MRRPRRGFTLIELLVVIVILALLIGLLLPAVMRAVGTARDATTSAEIQALAQALASFKSHFNEYPPSRIVVSETGDYSTATLGGAGTIGALLGPRSVAAIRRYWPRVQISTTGMPPNVNPKVNGQFYDFNGNDQCDATPYILTGPECLVFFLGGIPQATGSTWAMTGFSKNPANPFQSSTVTNNRTVPEMEFNNGRLVTNTLNTTLPAPGFPGYIDTLGGAADQGVIPFYAYFSAYGGAGYDPSDCDMTEPDTANGTTVVGGFPSNNCVNINLTTGSNVAKNNMVGYCWSPAPNPYTSSTPIPVDGTGAPDGGNKRPRAWINANSFQIISPGRDRYFGIGGQWLQQGTTRLPFVVSGQEPSADTFQSVAANVAVTGASLGQDERSRESDNITNFSGGRLD